MYNRIPFTWLSLQNTPVTTIGPLYSDIHIIVSCAKIYRLLFFYLFFFFHGSRGIACYTNCALSVEFSELCTVPEVVQLHVK